MESKKKMQLTRQQRMELDEEKRKDAELYHLHGRRFQCVNVQDRFDMHVNSGEFLRAVESKVRVEQQQRRVE